ncbi:Eco57I restriction-modification methylase domain-containing protein [Flavobacterium olei]|uniref:Eco57I restriction-modification methylase domain-containing protein n=1 Tax=Flavobacterium olei TaxID=1886782 RepID=UPI00321A22C9
MKNKEISKYIQNYSTDPTLVDRLIVSSFIKYNSLEVIHNEFIKDYVIYETDSEFIEVDSFISIVKQEMKEFDFEFLIELFEHVISPGDKVITGAIYTPKKIRQYIIEQSLKSKTDRQLFRLADIACGCGSFLYEATIYLRKLTKKSFLEIYSQNIFGLDIQNYSVIRSKILLTLLAIKNGEDLVNFNFNLYVGDALDFNWSDNIKNFTGFQIIVGNPPYVCSRNISEETKQHLKKWKVCETGHPDLYIPFFQIGIENLDHGGFLGYITMNTFFKSINGRALRKYFQELQYRFKIIDFGNKQIFTSKSTYTCVCFIEKINENFVQYFKNQSENIDRDYLFTKLKYDELDAKKGWNLEVANTLNKIEKTGKPFGEIYKTRNGIATLKNNIYIFDPVDEDEDYFHLQNGSLYQIEKKICVDIVNSNKFTQIDNVNEVRKKIIFPYEFINGKAKLINEVFFKDNYPRAYEYLNAKREILSKRDKGNGKYENWFAFGRNQSLEKIKNKLFFPHITPHIPNFVLDTDENLLFHNGLAVIAEDEDELLFLKKIMSSRLFWYYITNSSKPYGSGYFSLSRNYIKNFGIYNFSDEQKQYIISENDSIKLDQILFDLYEVVM